MSTVPGLSFAVFRPATDSEFLITIGTIGSPAAMAMRKARFLNGPTDSVPRRFPSGAIRIDSPLRAAASRGLRAAAVPGVEVTRSQVNLMIGGELLHAAGLGGAPHHGLFDLAGQYPLLVCHDRLPEDALSQLVDLPRQRRSRSFVWAAAVYPATSVPSRSKNAPTSGPSGPASTSAAGPESRGGR
jgi:hypothetical protein